MHTLPLSRLPLISALSVLAVLVALTGVTTASCQDPQPAPGLSFQRLGAPIDVGPMAASPIPADVDADGDLDVVIICGPCCGRDPVEESGHALVLLNDGTGVLSPAGPRMRLGPTALGGDVGDLNGDGHLDIAVFHHNSYDMGLLFGQGDGSFSPPRYLPLHAGEDPHVHALRLEDVNHDGHLDVLATLVADHALATLLGDGQGDFQPALGQPFFAHRHPYLQLNTADLNDDGHCDAVMTDVRGGGLTVLMGSGTGMFAPRNGFDLDTTMPITFAERPIASSLGDLDLDGDLDALLFIDERPQAVVMENRGDGHFQQIGTGVVDLGVATTGGALVDVDGDGRLDIVASSTMTDQVAVCLGRGGAEFGTPQRIDAGGTSPHAVPADLDGDGRVDLVTANYDSGTVSVLLNRGAAR